MNEHMLPAYLMLPTYLKDSMRGKGEVNKDTSPILFKISKSEADTSAYWVRSEDFRAKVEDDFVTMEEFLWTHINGLVSKYKAWGITLRFEVV